MLSRCLSGDIAVVNQFPMHFNASNSDRNDPMNTAASPATQVSVFFAGMRVIGPVWPASRVSRHNGGRSWLLDFCNLRASFCRFLVGFRHSRLLN